VCLGAHAGDLHLWSQGGDGVAFEASGVLSGSEYEFYFTPNPGLDRPWVLADTELLCTTADYLLWTNALHGPGRSLGAGWFRLGRAGDHDGDGLSDGFELIVLGTAMDDSDTDDDGLQDGLEDFDGDGKTNLEEYNHPGAAGHNPVGGASNPWHPDSDGDGVCDGPQVPAAWDLEAGPDAFPLDPSAWRDSDRDGRPDRLHDLSNSDPELVEDDDSNKTLVSDSFDVDTGAWSGHGLEGDTAAHHTVTNGKMRVSMSGGPARFAACHSQAVNGHFYAEVDLGDRRGCGLGLMQSNGGAPDTNNFTSIYVTTNAAGNVVIAVADRQDGVDNVLDNTGRMAADRYEHVLTNRYSVPFDDTDGRLRIMRDARSGYFHFYYGVRKYIRGAWAEGWMELAPSRDWAGDGQAYQVFVFVESEGVATEEQFDNMTIVRKQQNDQVDTRTGFRLTEREYNWSGYFGDAFVVTFDDAFPYAGQDRKFVFWSRFNYVPAWHLGDHVMYSYEFCETWGGGNRGCHEPMSDRLLRWSDVEVVEDNDVRKVLHWHYVLCNPDYKVPDDGEGTQLPEGDEYWTFYPDGSAVRHVRYTPKLDTDFREWNEVAELMVIADSMTDPIEHTDSPALTIMNMEGSWSKSFFPPVTQSYHDQAHEYDQFIIMTHFTNGIDAFTSFSHAEDVPETYSGYKLTTDIAWHNPEYIMTHWPVGREPYQTDNVTTGTWPAEVSHASLMGISAYYGYAQWTNHYKLDERGRKYRDWTALAGLHDAGDLAGIRARTKSWLYPGSVNVTGTNCAFERIDYQRKSLVFARTNVGVTCDFSMDPTAQGSTVINPAFEVMGWGGAPPAVRVDGHALAAPRDYRWAVAGTNLLVWVKTNLDRAVTVSIRE
jgi:hypothetical protein